MLLLRIVALLVAIAIGSSLVAYLLSRDRRYLVLSGRIAKYALIAAFVVLALLLLEAALRL